MSALLPPNSSTLERNLADTGAQLERASAPLHTLWSGQDIPAHLLPWLAWAVGAEDWSSSWSEQTKRDVVDAAIPIRRHRGTIWAVRHALETLGYRDVDIIEHTHTEQTWQAAGGRFLTGALRLTGTRTLGVETGMRVTTRHWAQYALGFDVASGPFTLTDQRLLRTRVERAAPLRSELVALIYRMALSWQNTITHQLTASRIRLAFTGCRAAKVHRADLLTGCRQLSGYDAPSLLAGTRRLQGLRRLTGTQPAGRPFGESWGTARSRIRLQMNAAAQTSQSERRLGQTHPRRLNGTGTVGHGLAGQRRLTGSRSWQQITLGHMHPRHLAGLHRLGPATTINSIGTTGKAYLRRGRHVTETTL